MIGTFFIVFGILLVCVVAMAVGVMAGRKPIKHCGSVVDKDGKIVECAVCGNMSCKNNKKGQAAEPAASSAENSG